MKERHRSLPSGKPALSVLPPDRTRLSNGHPPQTHLFVSKYISTGGDGPGSMPLASRSLFFISALGRVNLVSNYEIGHERESSPLTALKQFPNIPYNHFVLPTGTVSKLTGALCPIEVRATRSTHDLPPPGPTRANSKSRRWDEHPCSKDQRLRSANTTLLTVCL